MNNMFRCVIHGSFSKHYSEILEARKIFEDAGIEVLAPKREQFNKNKNEKLSEEAQDYLWALPSEALAGLDIEPNARHTLEIYQASI